MAEWIIVEDDATKLQHYLSQLVAQEQSGLRTGFNSATFVAPQTSFNSEFKTLMQKKTPSNFTISTEEIANKEDVAKFFGYQKSGDEDPWKNLKKNCLIVLDVEIPGVQGKDDFQSTNPTLLTNLWRHLTNPSLRNLLVISTAQRSGDQIKTNFNEKNNRFLVGKTFTLSSNQPKSKNEQDQSKAKADNNALCVLKDAHQKWREINDSSIVILRAMIEAQKLDPPGHPNNWSDATSFPLYSCFEGNDSMNLESFKSLFWYLDPDGREGLNLPDETSPATFTSNGLYIKVGTLKKILEKASLTVKYGTSGCISDDFLSLPGSPGACFVWRLLRFIHRLNEKPEELSLSVSKAGEKVQTARITLGIPDLRCLWAAVMTRMDSKQGAAVQAFKKLLSCSQPDDSELNSMKVFDSLKNRIKGWQPAFVHMSHSHKNRTHVHPVVWPEFDLENNTLTFRWRFKPPGEEAKD